MSSAASDEAYERLLLSNLERVIDFLRFAEAKNGALLTISSAGALAIGSLLLTEDLPVGCKFGLGLTVLLLLCACLAAVSAFWPQLKRPRFLHGAASEKRTKGLIYFGDIERMNVPEYMTAVTERYGLLDCPKAKRLYLDDLLEQVVINSQITAKKMRAFQLGTVFASLAILSAFATAAAYSSEFLMR